MHFKQGRPVHFQLRGELLSVCRSAEGQWRVSWRGRDQQARHLDHALAAVLERRPNEVVELAVRILRADPGSSVD
jgi:hypothetical protein